MCIPHFETFNDLLYYNMGSRAMWQMEWLYGIYYFRETSLQHFNVKYAWVESGLCCPAFGY